MKLFITGIGTDIGKTIASAVITEALEADYWKPIQAGDLDASDSHKVRAYISNTKTVIHANSYGLTTPASPHYAAQLDGVQINLDSITEPPTDNHLVIEGAGGLFVPLNDNDIVADLIKPDHKVIVVSRHYLGSINHTLLTIEALKNRNVAIAGIVFNGYELASTEEAILRRTGLAMIGRIEPEPYFDKNVIKEYADIFLPNLSMIMNNVTKKRLAERDGQHLWHPYTQHKTAAPPIGIVRGEGALLWDEDGKQYIDAIASWWVNPYGHSNRYIADAIYKQLTTLEHVLFGGFTHEPAVELSEKLMDILPSNQQKLFFSDNGSTAVEIALKVALQYYYNKSERRTKIIAFENAFHGDTFAAMAASGISFFTEAFKGSLIEVVRIPVPVKGKESESIAHLKALAGTGEYAAFIFEPLVQGAAGMIMYEPGPLDDLLSICKQHGIFTIADEVMTGFGKTGKTFACDYLTTKPDMMCLSKALTGGTIPMAITSFTRELFDGFYDDDVNKALFHGHTFTANPTGCAAALAGLELLFSAEMQNNLARINASHLKFKAHIEKQDRVKEVRVLGVIMALDIITEANGDYYGDFRNRLYNFFIENGVILRPVGSTVYILPPYVISDLLLANIYEIVEQAVQKIM